MQSVNEAHDGQKSAAGKSAVSAKGVRPPPAPINQSSSFANIMDFIQPDNDIFKEMGLSLAEPVVIPDEPEPIARPLPVKKAAEKQVPSGDLIKEALAEI